MSPDPANILIVNDGSLKSLDIQDRLTDLGYHVTSIDDFSNINLENVNESKADLILLDFIHELRNESYSIEEKVNKTLNIPVVFIAKSNNESAIDSKINHSNKGYILKQLEDSELKTTIDSVLEAHRKKIAHYTPILKTSSDSTNKEIFSKTINFQKSEKGESDAFNFLMKAPIFKELDKNDLKKLSSRAYFNTVHPGQYIEFEGENYTSCFIVHSGRIAMTKTTDEGKVLVVELLGPGDFFDLVFAIEIGPCDLSARAQIESEVLWIRTEDLRNVMDKNTGLYKDFTNYLTNLVNSSHDFSNELAHDSVKVRIASTLIDLLEKFSIKDDKDKSSMNIKITRHQIAELAGTTPETSTRVTREMHKKGIIDCGSPGIIRVLDIEQLEKFK